jgi:Zn-finger nucleic acid-binding protein
MEHAEGTGTPGANSYAFESIRYGYCPNRIPCYRFRMAAARCYECSSCGGLVREASRQCNYCGSPVATVRCGRCFTMNVVEALHCIGCGAQLGLMPIEHQPLAAWTCPRCRTHRLDAFCSDDGIIHDCSRCGGQFVPHQVLAILVNRYQSTDVALSRRLQRSNPLADKVTYLPCPDCRELMLRRNFGRVSGIIVDVCSVHGTWFDVGELPRILGFIGQGGMQYCQAVDAEERRAFVAARSHPNLAPTSIAGDADESFSWNEMYDAARSFAEWVRAMLR